MIAVLFISGCAKAETNTANSLSSDLSSLDELNNEMNALDIGSFNDSLLSELDSLL